MLAKLLYGYKATQCLYVAAKLNIADYLASGPKTMTELANSTNCMQEPLYRVIRCLISLGIFCEENDKFYLNEAAKDLLSDSENSMKDFIILCGEELYQAAGQLHYSVKTGLPAFDKIYGMTHWAYLNKYPEKANLFHDAMGKGTASMLNEIIKNYDFTPHKKIIDIGGGMGHLLCEILSQYPSATGIIYDLEHAKKSAINLIQQKILTDRCEFIAGNLFLSAPTEGDLYLLKVVLHDWDDQNAKVILQTCRKSMSEASKLLIIEKVIENNQLNDMACLGDINMLVTYSGRERTLNEFQTLIDESGFKLLRKICTGSVFSIIETEAV